MRPPLEVRPPEVAPLPAEAARRLGEALALEAEDELLPNGPARKPRAAIRLLGAGEVDLVLRPALDWSHGARTTTGKVRVEAGRHFSATLLPGGEVWVWRAPADPEKAQAVADELRRVLVAFLENPAGYLARGWPSCGLCGRALTDPSSRLRGFGPDCAGRFGELERRLVGGPA